MNNEWNKGESDKFVGKPLFIFYTILISIGIISTILVFLDRQNYLIYSEIVFFVAFLFFLVKGINFIKNDEYKSGIACFTVVVVYISVKVLEILMFSGAF